MRTTSDVWQAYWSPPAAHKTSQHKHIHTYMIYPVAHKSSEK